MRFNIKYWLLFVNIKKAKKPWTYSRSYFQTYSNSNIGKLIHAFKSIRERNPTWYFIYINVTLILSIWWSANKARNLRLLTVSPHFTVSKNVFLSECKDKRNKLCKCSISYDINSLFRDSAILKCISLRIFLMFHQWHLIANIGFWLGKIPWQHAFYRTRKRIVKHINNDNFVFFFYQGFLSWTLTIHGTAVEGRNHIHSSLPLPPVHEDSDIY